MRILAATILFVALASMAFAQAPGAPPTADQATAQLCDMNRVQGEKNAGAIIAANLKMIADVKAVLCPADPNCDPQAAATALKAESLKSKAPVVPAPPK